MIITGDWNLHDPMWSQGMVRTRRNTKEIVDWLFKNEFFLLNKKGQSTHLPHNTDLKPSIIDLTWVNSHVFRHDTVKF
jgi:hypothetical protein